MKRSELTENQRKKYCWDFSYLFKNDEEWLQQLNQVDNYINDIMLFRGKLAEKAKLQEYLKISKAMNFFCQKLEQYLNYANLDQTNLVYQDLKNLYEMKMYNMNTKLSWIEPELKKIGYSVIKKWIAEDPQLAVYDYYFKVFFHFDKYILSENNEILLSKVAESRYAINQMYDTLVYADKQKIMFDYQGKTTELTQTLYLDILQNSKPQEDQKLRLQVNKLFYQDIDNKKHSLAQIYQAIIKQGIEELNIRYNDQQQDENQKMSILAYHLESDKVTPAIYQDLIKVGHEHANLVTEYYKIKKAFFALTNFYVTDKKLKMGQKPKQKYDVENGIKEVKNALRILGTEYMEQLELALLPGRVDYFEDTNKVIGAYSTGGEAVDPIILMNWDDTVYSLNVLAHELGHSVHSLFAAKYQEYPNSSYPIILAEVASTINEHLLFDYLYGQAKTDTEKIYFLENHIENIIGSFFNQITFAEFELKANEMVVNHEPLNADNLADLYKAVSDKYSAKVIDELEPKTKNYNWASVPHFFHSPFYVYKYATSITVSYKLYEDIKNKQVDNLLKFLKAGGSDDALVILKNAGVDLTDKNVYTPLINNLTFLINELKILVNNVIKNKEY